MRTFVKVLVCCLLIGSLCGCQLTKNPATTSSVSKEDAESLVQTIDDASSITSVRTDTSISSVDSGSAVSFKNESVLFSKIEDSLASATDSSKGKISSTENSSSSETSDVSSAPSYVSPNQTSNSSGSVATYITPPRKDFDRLNNRNPDEEFLKWIKSSFRQNSISETQTDAAFLKWARTQKGILMPKLNNNFKLYSIDIECESNMLYQFRYISQDDNRDFLDFDMFPILDEDKDVESLLELIKQYNYRTGNKKTKYRKGNSECKWGTYYIETSFFGTVWFKHDNYLVSCRYENEFTSKVFKLIDFELEKFGDVFDTEHDFVNWIKTNRKNPDKSQEGKYLLRELKAKSEIVFPKTKSDVFYLKEVYPVCYGRGYRVVFATEKSEKSIESLVFEVVPSSGVNDWPKSWVFEESRKKNRGQKPELVKSIITEKCNKGNYIIYPDSTDTYFSHKDFDIKYTVNFKDKDKSGGFKEEYFDLFDFEYISFE